MNAAEQALRAVLQVVRAYLPPDGPSAEASMVKIAELVDPFPITVWLPSEGVQLGADKSGRVYIAGPMTGIPEWNFPAFNAAAEDLRSMGWSVCNPADHGIVEGAEWGDYLRHDLKTLATCEAIYFLPGWSKSRGARLEMQIAQGLGLRMDFADGAEGATAAAGVADREALAHAAFNAAPHGRWPDDAPMWRAVVDAVLAAQTETQPASEAVAYQVMGPADKAWVWASKATFQACGHRPDFQRRELVVLAQPAPAPGAALPDHDFLDDDGPLETGERDATS